MQQHLLPNGQYLIIRPPAIEDAPALLESFRQQTRETDFLLLTPEEAAAMTIQEEETFIQSYLNHPQHLLLLAEVNGQLAGSISVNQQPFRKQAHIGIMGIAVSRPYWNLGIGRRLMTAMIRWAEQHPDITLIQFSTSAHNDKAIHLYRNFGFQEYGRIPDNMKGTDGTFAPVILMQKLVK
ncbi:GNAT family N-acetyltransferase [Chitinophaga pendula]|uniref:GNAT family N-acetyltransferase n=1 Tax=Chitinophaga TaxID=79328 RepID=UPI000BAFD06B|nr:MULTISPECIES: GNAT family N-acetyltransferase [Chitinophaga]ASZ09939.1 hypothetical protein CK934_02555 [Chitinophaga sp. MD30]UCJ07121.1 GNAT family N-acetyltransferase [Chitinophaga pendula]